MKLFGFSNIFNKIKWGLILISASAFILNNLDVIGIKMENPIPWLKVSNGMNLLREPLDETAMKIRKGDIKSLDLVIDASLEYEKLKPISKLQMDNIVRKKIYRLIQDGKINNLDVNKSKCPKFIDALTEKMDSTSLSCEFTINTVKNIIYTYNQEYYKKDFRFDSFMLTQSELINKNNHFGKFIEKDKEVVLLIDKQKLSDEDIFNLVKSKHLDLYNKGIKLENSITKDMCPEKMNSIFSLHAQFDCEINIFNIKEAKIIYTDNINKIRSMNTNLVKMIFHDVRVKV